VWDKTAPEDYARTKFEYAQGMLDLAKVVSPTLQDAIEEVEVATPQTLKHYLGIPGGAIYGFDQDVTDSWLFRDSDLKPNVPGLPWSAGGPPRAGTTRPS